MDGNQFIPKMGAGIKVEQAEQPVPADDSTGKTLLNIARYAVVVLFGLLPIFFMPGLWASLGFDKTMLTIVTAVIVIVSGSLFMLRQPKMSTVVPLPLLLFWLLILAAFVSAFLSGDVQDSLRGSVMETQTVAFLGVMAVAMTLPLLLQGSKILSIKTLALFGSTAFLILLYNLIRFITGPEVLSFSNFSNLTVSPIGGFNDLAIFSGLIIVFSLVTLVQLPLKTWLQSVVAVITVISLIMLAVVNFFYVWIVVGFFAFILFLYLLSRDTLFVKEGVTPAKNSKILVAVTSLVCLTSVLFIVAGDFAGAKVSQLTNVDHVEVRPSVAATIDIANAVYKEDALLGVGPNRFADAWRQYKDPSINETIFWDTDFVSGSGFVSTVFVNLGLLGGLLLVLFQLSFVYLGYRMLLKSSQNDSYWYYLGTVSFASAVFIWFMSYIYVPGSTILLLGALFSGLTFVAAGSLLPKMVRTVSLGASRRLGFLLMAVIIIVVTSAVTILFSAGKQYVAQSTFSKAQNSSETLSQFDQEAATSYGMYPDDRFISARTQAQLSTINTLLKLEEPTEIEQQTFLTASELALGFANQAIKQDYSNPDNHAILSSVYSSLATVGIEGAQKKAVESLARAEQLDPLNPGYHLIAAQLAVRTGDVDLAREEILAALGLKRNYTEALYLLAQLEISQNNTESAISATQAIVTLEPGNPTRYFQLGVLLSANEQSKQAISAFQKAISIDPAYANARYLLALAYENEGQSDLALEQLNIVLQTNSDNAQLISIIGQIETGKTVSLPDFGLETPVNDVSPTGGFADTVTTEGDTETDLVSPLNTVSESVVPSLEEEKQVDIAESEPESIQASDTEL